MSVEAMKQALEALNWINDEQAIISYEAVTALRQAIAEAEKQEPVAIGEEWKPCVKLPIIVHVREQRKGETHVSTREGITPVKEDDLIMRGVAGEEYPIGRELFNRTYTFDTAPVHASDISQERVDETAKREHEFEEMVKRGTKAWADTPDNWVDELRGGVEKREWVGLADEDLEAVFPAIATYHETNKTLYRSIAKAIEAKLKEKNT
jgi:hypothetical protein